MPHAIRRCADRKCISEQEAAQVILRIAQHGVKVNTPNGPALQLFPEYVGYAPDKHRGLPHVAIVTHYPLLFKSQLKDHIKATRPSFGLKPGRGKARAKFRRQGKHYKDWKTPPMLLPDPTS